MPGGVGGARADFPIRRLHTVIADQVHDAATALLDHERQRVAKTTYVAHELQLQAFVQSSSVRCSMTPPAAEPALLTMMSTRPSSLWARSMKFLASAVLPRSAGMATILRLVARAISDAVAFQHILAPRADGHVHALLGECNRNALADAFAAAGDERGLALKLQVHFSLLVSEDRLGGVADGFDVLTSVEEGDDTARTAFEAFVAPREGADDGALAEHQLDIAAEILGVLQPFLERPVVEREHVGGDLAS